MNPAPSLHSKVINMYKLNFINKNNSDTKNMLNKQEGAG